MGKREVLLDAVKKMLSLKGVTDAEIVQNLKEVGISETEARSLLDEVRGSAEVPRRLQRKQISDAEVLKDANRFEKFETETPNVPETVSPLAAKPETAFSKSSKTFAKDSEEMEAGLGQLWQKGIMTSIDEKLREMRELKEEIDSVLDEKIEARVKKESQKFNVLMDSQKTLFLSKASSELGQRSGELSSLVQSQMAELKKMNSDLQGNLQKLDAQKQVSSSLLENVSEKLAEVDLTTKRVTSEGSKSFSETQQKMRSFLDEAENKLKDMDLRISKTLELEQQIADSFMRSAEDKIDEIVSRKVSTASRSAHSPEMAEELNSLKSKIAELQDAVEIVKKRPPAPSSTVRVQTLTEKELKEKMEELKLFQEQFKQVVQKSVAQFNTAASQFNELRSKLNGLADKRSEEIDAKIKELEEFEAQFAKEIGEGMEKWVEKKKRKSTSKR